MRRALVTSAAALLVALGVLVPGPAGAAGAAGQQPSGVGLALADVPRTADARSRSYVVVSPRPGDVVERRLVAVNHTDAPVRVRLYLASATVRDGAFVVGPRPGTGSGSGSDSGSDPGTADAWGQVTPASAVVPAGGRLPVRLRLTVPAETTAGERFGGIVLEQQPAAATDRSGTPVLVTNRVAVRMYVAVNAGATPHSDLALQSITARAGSVVLTVRNTGARALDVAGTAGVEDGPAGSRAGPFPATTTPVVLPGKTAELTVPLPRDLPGGSWLVKAAVYAGSLTRVGEARLVLGPGPGPTGAVATAVAPPVETGPVGGPARDGLPWPALAFGGSGLVLLLLLVLFARRRRVEELPVVTAVLPTARTAPDDVVAVPATTRS